MEKYWLSIISDEKRGFFAFFLRFILLLLSGIYYLGLQIIQLLYKLRILRRARLKAKVISVGNLTVGGTGKTPATEKIAGLLQKIGRKVAILSRGYKSCPKSKVSQRDPFGTSPKSRKRITNGELGNIGSR